MTRTTDRGPVAAMTGTCLLCPGARPTTGTELLDHLAKVHGLPTRPAQMNRQEAVAFNVLSAMLPQGSWMPLADRAAIARALVEALHLDEHLHSDVGDVLTSVPMRGVAS